MSTKFNSVLILSLIRQKWDVLSLSQDDSFEILDCDVHNGSIVLLGSHILLACSLSVRQSTTDRRGYELDWV